MIGALVVTHGHLGQELVAAAEMIVGDISHIKAVSIGWHDDVNDARKDIEKRLAEVESGNGCDYPDGHVWRHALEYSSLVSRSRESGCSHRRQPPDDHQDRRPERGGHLGFTRENGAGPGTIEYFHGQRFSSRMIRQSVLVSNKLGLHARAAAKLVRLASRFSSEIHLSREDANQQIDSKSILGVLMLAASKGTRLVITIEGQDEVEAVEAIRGLFEEKFGEES